MFDLSSDSTPSKNPKKIPNTSIATVPLFGISNVSQKETTKTLKQLKDNQNLLNLERKLHQYSQDHRNGESNIAPKETELSNYYECPVCKKYFANFSEVEKHKKSAHQVRNISPKPPAAPTCIIQPTCTVPSTPSTWIHKRKSFESTPLDQQKKIRLQFGPSEIQLENKQDNETITLDTIRLGSIEPVHEIINLDEDESQEKQYKKIKEIGQSGQEKQQHKRKDIVTVMPEGEKFMNGNLKLVVGSHELHTNQKHEKLEQNVQFLKQPDKHTGLVKQQNEQPEKENQLTPLDQQKKIRLQFGPSEIQLEKKQNEIVTLDSIETEPIQEIINLDEDKRNQKERNKQLDTYKAAKLCKKKQSEISEKENYFECPICGQCFVNFSDIELHNRSKHPKQLEKQQQNKKPQREIVILAEDPKQKKQLHQNQTLVTKPPILTDLGNQVTQKNQSSVNIQSLPDQIQSMASKQPILVDLKNQVTQKKQTAIKIKSLPDLLAQITNLQKTNSELNIKHQQSERKNNDYLQTIMHQQKILDQQKLVQGKQDSEVQTRMFNEQMNLQLKQKLEDQRQLYQKQQQLLQVMLRS